MQTVQILEHDDIREVVDDTLNTDLAQRVHDIFADGDFATVIDERILNTDLSERV